MTRVTIAFDEVRSPAAQGVSLDERQLGLAVTALRFVAGDLIHSLGLAASPSPARAASQHLPWKAMRIGLEAAE